MGRKAKAPLEGQILIYMTPEEMAQLQNICMIRMELSVEGLCRGFILTGMQRETKDILASVALSYKLERDMVAKGDQETDLSSSPERARDACGPVCNPLEITLNEFIEEKLSSSSKTAPTKADFSDGLIKFGPIALDMASPIKFEVKPDELDPPLLDEKGLRGGEADEESLQKAQGTERANMHGTRNADLDLPRSTAAKGREVDQYPIHVPSTLP